MNASESATSRRTFLSMTLGGLGAVIAAASVYPIWRFLRPREDTGEDTSVTLARNELSADEATFFTYKWRPAVVLQTSPGTFVALSAVCTHLGCIVKWESENNSFLCPCHGGRFSPQGEVLSGPPPAALESLPVTLDGDQLIIGEGERHV